MNAFDVQQAFEESSLDIAITYVDKALRRYNRTRVLYTEEYEHLIRKGATFSSRKSVSWEELGQLPLCLLPPENHIFGAREAALLNEALSKTSQTITSAVWMVMDHVRTGNWASVLPRPVRTLQHLLQTGTNTVKDVDGRLRLSRLGSVPRRARRRATSGS